MLDTNLYRLLVNHDGAEKLRLFNHCFAKYINKLNRFSPTIKSTPSGVLEAIGLVPPRISKPDFGVIKAESAAGDILAFTREFYRSELKRTGCLSMMNVAKLTARQREYIHPKCRDHFDQTIGTWTAAPDFELNALNCLSLDYTFKVDYPEHLTNKINDSLAELLLAKLASEDHSGKYRIVWRLWRGHHNRLVHKYPDHRIVLARVSKALSLKTHRDYFDGDLISFLCQGYSDRSRVLRVIAFTMDSAQLVSDRVYVFKGLMNYLSNGYLDRHQIDDGPLEGRFKQGAHVTCNSNGEMVGFVSVADMPSLY